ncbi:MAG: hypothetical protein ACK4P3_09765 [Fimbriimonadaceae bacterium]
MAPEEESSESKFFAGQIEAAIYRGFDWISRQPSLLAALTGERYLPREQNPAIWTRPTGCCKLECGLLRRKSSRVRFLTEMVGRDLLVWERDKDFNFWNPVPEAKGWGTELDMTDTRNPPDSWTELLIAVPELNVNDWHQLKAGLETLDTQSSPDVFVYLFTPRGAGETVVFCASEVLALLVRSMEAFVRKPITKDYEDLSEAIQFKTLIPYIVSNDSG